SQRFLACIGRGKASLKKINEYLSSQEGQELLKEAEFEIDPAKASLYQKNVVLLQNKMHRHDSKWRIYKIRHIFSYFFSTPLNELQLRTPQQPDPKPSEARAKPSPQPIVDQTAPQPIVDQTAPTNSPPSGEQQTIPSAPAPAPAPTPSSSP